MPDDSEAFRVPVELTGAHETLAVEPVPPCRRRAGRGTRDAVPAGRRRPGALSERRSAGPGQALVFDATSGGMRTARTRAGEQSADRSSSEWLWSNDAAVRSRLAALPGVAALRRLPTVYGRSPLFGRAFPTLRRLPGLGKRLPDFHAPVFRIDFAG